MISLTNAEDHKAWALQQQARSQAMIKSYEQEVLALKRQKAPIPRSIPRSVKACRANQSLPCSKKPVLEPTQEATVYIFVSFSMPKETIKILAHEAEKQKGILVIRGLVDNSFVKTAKAIQEIGAGVVLDPTLFKEYDIKVVPTFVQKHKNAYQRIAGNVSLSYALEVFTREKVEDETLKDEKVIDKKTRGERNQ
jgi:type-F conjugative transfer system pilin assembly protein TrbC